MGVDVPVLAWGIGIDRMALMALGLNDLRELFCEDIEKVRLRKAKFQFVFIQKKGLFKKYCYAEFCSASTLYIVHKFRNEFEITLFFELGQPFFICRNFQLSVLITEAIKQIQEFLKPMKIKYVI